MDKNNPAYRNRPPLVADALLATARTIECSQTKLLQSAEAWGAVYRNPTADLLGGKTCKNSYN